jgi:hypothetical protein
MIDFGFAELALQAWLGSSPPLGLVQMKKINHLQR